MSNIINLNPTRGFFPKKVGIPLFILPSNYSDNSTDTTVTTTTLPSNALAGYTSGLNASGTRSAAPVDNFSCHTTATVSALSFFVAFFFLALIGLVIYVMVLRDTVKSMMSIGEERSAARNPLSLLKIPDTKPIASHELGDTNESVQFVAPSTRQDGPHVYLQFEDRHYSNNVSQDNKQGDHSCMQGVVNNDDDLAQDNDEGNYINVPYNARIV